MCVAWRDLHEHFGKWSSVYRQFRRWTLSGLWELLLEAFNESGGGDPTLSAKIWRSAAAPP
jgi:transposase